MNNIVSRSTKVPPNTISFSLQICHFFANLLRLKKQNLLFGCMPVGAPGPNVVEMTKWAIPGNVPLGSNVPAMNSFHSLTQIISGFHCSIIILKIELTQLCKHIFFISNQSLNLFLLDILIITLVLPTKERCVNNAGLFPH